ncbi:MAG: ATP/GTP-binding protein [Bacteroidales bacterium]|jgi:hypothetical protein|nr:ATP/GTP-binding protein [Bacteroidales bacterium]
MKNLIFKTVLLAVTSFMTFSLSAQYTLEKLWETDSLLATPESVLYDAESEILFVSNIGDFQKEGSGSVSKVGLDGEITHNQWITGLTATKGMGRYNNLLYAAEQTTIAVIDTKKGVIIQRIAVEGAQFLNDVTINQNGTLFVSDSRTGKVHKIDKGNVSVYIEDLNGVNGLLSDGNDLYILADGKLMKADNEKNLTTLAEGIEGGADGIVKINENEFIVTGWEGVIYHISNSGVKRVLSDTRDEQINSADLGYNPADKIIYIPTFSKNSVVAYRLK